MPSARRSRFRSVEHTTVNNNSLRVRTVTENSKREQSFFPNECPYEKVVIEVPATPTHLVPEKIVPASTKERTRKHFLFGWLSKGKVPAWVLVVAWILFFGWCVGVLLLLPVTPTTVLDLLTVLIAGYAAFVVLWRSSCIKLSWHGSRKQKLSIYAVIFLTSFFATLLIGKGITGSTSQPDFPTSTLDVEQTAYLSCAKVLTHVYPEGHRPQGGDDTCIDLQIGFHEAISGTQKNVDAEHLAVGQDDSLSMQPIRLNVTIPAGVETGTRLRVINEGHAAPDGSSGDLYIYLQVSQAE